MLRWTLQRPTVHTDVPDLLRKNKVLPAAAYELALYHLSTIHSKQVEVHTSGSVIEGGSAAAFCAPHQDSEQVFKLASEISSTGT